MALCLKSRKIYTQWNDEMKKVYGKFAALDATTVSSISLFFRVSDLTKAGFRRGKPLKSSAFSKKAEVSILAVQEKFKFVSELYIH